MKSLFKEKFDFRVNILGDENNNIEKKILLQIIDFLEVSPSIFGAIRQVIGLDNMDKKTLCQNLKKRLLYFSRDY